MNRKTFLSTLGAILAAPFLIKVETTSKNTTLIGVTKDDLLALERGHFKSGMTGESRGFIHGGHPVPSIANRGKYI